ncbi:MAG: SET domain-containing protein-lysine N-methyltransferase, partial [Planctomycetaceae bacterium]|nr:SET domain-containing protein-lysine N-methyltransferase [Planctomycetaceae bacterium]
PFRGIDEGTRRKIVYPNDLIKYYKVWDKKLLKVFHRIPHLDQPLKELLTEEMWNEIVEVSKRNREMKSILTNYYHGENGEEDKKTPKESRKEQKAAV